MSLELTLLQQVGRGEAAAMEQCIKRFGGLVFSIARKFLRQSSDVEDAVQDIFADLWANAHRYDPKIASEETMVALIARRRLIDRKRREGRRPVLEALPEPAQLPSSLSGGHRQVEHADDISRVKEFLLQLNAQQRNALKLSLFEGWSHQRISEELKLPLGTVKTHIRRGLARVRELMSKGTYAEKGGAQS